MSARAFALVKVARKHVDEIEQRWWEETAEGRAVSGKLPAPAGGNPIKEI